MSHRLLATAALVLVAALPAAASAATAPPSGPGCDRLDDAACLLPFPNDAFTRKDRHTATGLRLALGPKQTPRNADGVAHRPDRPQPHGRLQPGLRHPHARSPAWRRPGRWRARTRSGSPGWRAYARRVRAGAAPRRAHRASASRSGSSSTATPRTRATACSRSTRRATSPRAAATSSCCAASGPPRAAASRPGGASPRCATASCARARYDRIFRTLKKAEVRRGPGLFLTWDFTVASRALAVGAHAPHPRRRLRRSSATATSATASCRARAPRFTLGEASLNGDDAKYRARWGKVLEGTIEVPCYLDQPGCAPGARFNLGRGRPARPAAGQRPRGALLLRRAAHGDRRTRRRGCPSTATACSAATARSSRTPTSPPWPRSTTSSSARRRGRACRTRTSRNAVSVLQDLGRMPTIADRLQQGMLDALYLGRLMIHPQGLAANPLLQQARRGRSCRTGHLYYDGNSQGGIMGGALTAVAPDFTRAVARRARHELQRAAAAVGRLRRPTARSSTRPTPTSSSARWSSTSRRCCGTAARPTATPST